MVKKLLLWSMILIQVNSFSQDKYFIPDPKLRQALVHTKTIEGDSLIISKAKIIRSLFLSDWEIENLDGLQFFELTNNLDLRNNRLTKLEYLPKSLEHLNVSNNMITEINGDFNSLQKLYCNNNVIKIIKGDFKQLEFLECSNNRLKKLPHIESLKYLKITDNRFKKLPLNNNLTYINYYNNPINPCSIPDSICEIGCRNSIVNCTLNNYNNWDILGFKNLNKLATIDSIYLEMSYSNALSKGKHSISPVDSGSYFIYTNGLDEKALKEPLKISKSDIISLINDLSNHKTTFQIDWKDSIKTIDLSNMKSFSKRCATSVSHETYYNLHLQIFSNNKQIDLNYPFSASDAYSSPLCDFNKTNQDIRGMINFLYIKRLFQIIPEHYALKNLYHSGKIEKLVKWYDSL